MLKTMSSKTSVFFSTIVLGDLENVVNNQQCSWRKLIIKKFLIVS